jgi:hypothetical protein
MCGDASSITIHTILFLAARSEEIAAKSKAATKSVKARKGFMVYKMFMM